MRHYLISAFLISNCLLFAQKFKINLDAIDVNFGYTASDMFNSYVVDRDSIGRGYIAPASQRIVYATRFEFILRRQLSTKRYLTFGLLLKNYRYMSTICPTARCLKVFHTIGFPYTTFQLSHQYNFANNHFAQLFLENGLHLDYTQTGKKRQYTRLLSLSMMAKLNCYFKLSKINQIVFSPTLNLPLSRYNRREKDSAFLPFAYGVTLGYSRNFGNQRSKS